MNLSVFDEMVVPDPGPGWRLVDTDTEAPDPRAERYYEACKQWYPRHPACGHSPYWTGWYYRVPIDEDVSMKADDPETQVNSAANRVFGLPDIPAPDWGDHEFETYRDRVASSRMLGQLLFGAICFLGGCIAGWIGSLLCSWLFS